MQCPKCGGNNFNKQMVIDTTADMFAVECNACKHRFYCSFQLATTDVASSKLIKVEKLVFDKDVQTEKEIERGERWLILLTLCVVGVVVTLPFIIHLLRG